MHFFEVLRELLERAGVDLSVSYGQGMRFEDLKKDSGALAWASRVRNMYIAYGERYLVWQPLPEDPSNYSLIVLSQENRVLSNYPLMMRRAFGGPKLAFWGHGANLQGNSHRVMQKLKAYTATKVDWWFAYTGLSADIVSSSGFPKSKITTVNNAVDTTRLCLDRQSVTVEQQTALRERLSLSPGLVGAFVGSFHADKRLDFLIKACELTKERIPGFQMLVVGDGPDRSIIELATRKHKWIHWVGAQYGSEKALYVSLADVLLNPGMVGLGVLDSFVFGVPLLTTNCNIHSLETTYLRHGPEITYLRHGINGLITENTLDAFVGTLSNLLKDRSALNSMKQNCLSDATTYTVERMAENFAGGIIRCLEEGESHG